MRLRLDQVSGEVWVAQLDRNTLRPGDETRAYSGYSPLSEGPFQIRTTQEGRALVVVDDESVALKSNSLARIGVHPDSFPVRGLRWAGHLVGKVWAVIDRSEEDDPGSGGPGVRG